MTPDYDFAVVGGGIIGLAVASVVLFGLLVAFSG